MQVTAHTQGENQVCDECNRTVDTVNGSLIYEVLLDCCLAPVYICGECLHVLGNKAASAQYDAELEHESQT